ncbi:hypothetical protein [Idiomarina xiamenensis]|uniref:Uncharacterized protein n=1 Tax=Idiomarina xiamenensis 10-D-4 TaxID=740709 RepID=K2K1T8_9GAMM|nr:hypothetical protein [Idiomarina xiamenensis]EKE80642.1 hypothetical protein A10D4_11806 [Idiomarina xiamenensis 10-D-4]
MTAVPQSTSALFAVLKQQLSRHPAITLLDNSNNGELCTRHGNSQGDELRGVVSFADWQRRIEATDIEQAAARVKADNLSCLVLLTSVGISRDAWLQVQMARQVKCVTLRQPLQLGWLDDLAERIVNRQVIIPELSDFVFMEQLDGQPHHFEIPERDALDSEVTDSDIIVRDAAGNSHTLHQVYKQEVEAARFKGAGQRQLSIEFAAGSELVRPNGRRHAIHHMQFNYQQRVIEENLDLSGNDLIALILFSLFEDCHFVLSARGDIYATQPAR